MVVVEVGSGDVVVVVVRAGVGVVGFVGVVVVVVVGVVGVGDVVGDVGEDDGGEVVGVV
ncbi:hypothetical protein PILCRDRAFT_812401 [Piloderma croceum F 1598]|uniref:Uncharacterized protein n=1 Tax=Piloderma croceum (strain F 1598) TaxID=765440 RepID=A0A0C3GFY9_PILCF|nr:hypothetical protein PILCRDRAFT_812401 [Piloderma croceum F 1598]